MFDPLSNFKLNKIISAISALPTTLANSFTEVKNAIAGVQNTTNTIDANVNSLASRGFVKSVQRGTEIKALRGGNNLSTSISISSVNVAKSFLIIRAQMENSTYGPLEFMSTLNSDSISIIYTVGNYGGMGTVDGYFEWQVVEFY